MCDGAEQRAAGHRTLDTGTLDGIRRYDGDPGAGPGTRDRTSLSHALILPACGGSVRVSPLSPLSSSSSRVVVVTMKYVSSPARALEPDSLLPPAMGRHTATSFLRRNQGADPRQPSTFNIDTILTSSIPYEFFLFLCRLGIIINRILV